MSKKEVNWCDECEKEIARGKCEICDKDLCEDCYHVEEIFNKKGRIELCGGCSNLELDEKFGKDLKERVVEHLRKQAVLNKLEEEEHPNIEYDENEFNHIPIRRLGKPQNALALATALSNKNKNCDTCHEKLHHKI